MKVQETIGVLASAVFQKTQLLCVGKGKINKTKQIVKEIFQKHNSRTRFKQINKKFTTFSEQWTELDSSNETCQLQFESPS